MKTTQKPLKNNSRKYNNHKPVHPEATKHINQKCTFFELDDPITWEEFIFAVNKLKNDKTPGLNGVPPNTIKAMNKENLTIIFNFLQDFWENNADYKEWHEGQYVPVAKKGDLKYPNNW